MHEQIEKYRKWLSERIRIMEYNSSSSYDDQLIAGMKMAKKEFDLKLPEATSITYGYTTIILSESSLSQIGQTLHICNNTNETLTVKNGSKNIATIYDGGYADFKIQKNDASESINS